MKKLLLLAGIVLFMQLALAQQVSDHLLKQQWKAYWIAVPKQQADAFGVSHFRKSFSLKNKPQSFIINVSGDNKYKLYVNGHLMTFGPARRDVHHWAFETIEIAPLLQAGSNVIAAVVSNFSKGKAIAQMSYSTGFILQGNTSAEEVVNTDKTWKCIDDSAYGPVTPKMVYTYYVMGDNEHVDLNYYPTDWEQPGFDDSKWADAITITPGIPSGTFDWGNSWILEPRGFPLEELTAQRIPVVRLTEGVNLPKSFPLNKSPFTVPPHQKVSILLDQQALTTAFPVLEFSKGKDARITLGYAEALFANEKNTEWRKQIQKGNRNEIENKHFAGAADIVIANGTNNQSYSPLFWRTFRYLKLDIETNDEGLQINDIYSLFTAYPFSNKAVFNTANPLLKQILETGWHTARLCAHDNYMDCPYYEQLQYIGDTRIQSLISLFNTGDDRLMRNAIQQIHNSLLPQGITLSRFPTAEQQLIPPFSLLWIGMLHDYYQYRDDKSFIAAQLACSRQILGFFGQYQQEDGHLLKPPYWEFTDWAEGKGWDFGVAPIGKHSESASLDLQLLQAYQYAVELEQFAGYPELASVYNRKAVQLQAGIKAAYWDAERQLFADTRDKSTFSQHVNTLAILTGIVTGKDAEDLAHKLIAEKSLTKATLYFRYYVNLALTKAGLGDHYLDQLDIWKANLDAGLTTWAETDDLNRTRSDCHAWGASPNIEFYRTVLGIDAASPGFKKVKIEPHLGYLNKISGSIPHPEGTIAVDFQKQGNGQLKAVIIIPNSISGVFVWKNKSYQLKGGSNEITAL